MRDRVFDMLEAELHRTVYAVLAITQQKDLLEKNQVLARSIRLRNPYVDPMHLIQVDMLRRKRAGERHAGSESRHCGDHQRHFGWAAEHRLRTCRPGNWLRGESSSCGDCHKCSTRSVSLSVRRTFVRCCSGIGCAEFG